MFLPGGDWSTSKTSTGIRSSSSRSRTTTRKSAKRESRPTSRPAARRTVEAREITAAAIASFDGCPDPRTRLLLRALTQHLHAFVSEAGITQAEWEHAIGILTATGEITHEHRQEFVLWSDVLGVSMLLDALAVDRPIG